MRYRLPALVTFLLLAALVAVTPARAADGQVHKSQSTTPAPGDVYVVVGGVLKNPTDTTPPDAQLLNIVGTPIGATWGQWKAATATAYAVTGNRGATAVYVTAAGLVPNGVYSFFWLTFGPDSSNPACPVEERALPFTSFDKEQVPDRTSFVADATGHAKFKGYDRHNLLGATIVEYELIYHSDGHTYGDVPNAGENATRGPDCRSSFGSDAHRHLLVIQQSP